MTVSIHAPWEGCDRCFTFKHAVFPHVSIHAPWEGCDRFFILCSCSCLRFNSRTLGRVRPVAIVSLKCIACFNSRTLGRVRLCATALYICSAVFQFTHPGKGATCRLCLASICEEVSIHAPWEGCDYIWTAIGCLTSRFNSRTLGRVRRGGERRI